MRLRQLHMLRPIRAEARDNDGGIRSDIDSKDRSRGRQDARVVHAAPQPVPPNSHIPIVPYQVSIAGVAAVIARLTATSATGQTNHPRAAGVEWV